MIYLLIAVLCGSMSVILFKIFSRKGVDAMAAVTVNYFTAFVLGWVLNVVRWLIRLFRSGCRGLLWQAFCSLRPMWPCHVRRLWRVWR